jgi:hypothetical protein
MDKCQARPVTISEDWGDGQASPDNNVHPVEFPGGNPIQQDELSLPS